MKYQNLIDSCKKAIEKGWCLGCQPLENPYFTGNENCKYGKTPTAKESISIIHQNLGIQENFLK